MENKGYVYILTNPSFREDWVKIGKSAREVDVRAAELDNTAVPLPFEVYATIKTAKYNEVESLVHRMIDRISDLRIRQNREFFNIEPAVALSIFNDIAATVDDAEVVCYRDNHPITHEDMAAENKKKKSRFRFSMVGIKIGEVIVFEPTKTHVKVASDDTIEYEGRIYKLSPFVGTFLPENMRTPSGAYQGAKYFTYKGHVLNEMRKEMGQ